MPRAADSPPDMLRDRGTKPGTGARSLELVEADVDEQAKPAEAVEPPVAPGTVFADKYVVERQIGRGGIGVIVDAQHMQLGQHVAIKYLQKRVLGNRQIIERFAREARLAAQIKSDHVVRVHDVANHPELGPYMVMEFLEGTDLGHLVEAGPLPIADAVDYVLQGCDALAEAHALGIVHRDIKPDNLFLAKRPAGRSIVKILDFGISKAAPTQRMSGGWAHVTTASETFGTPVYMSPEQLRSTANVDARSDIWAIGVVLFELLTADLPFVGETVAQLCTSILSDPPRSLRSLRSEVPEGLAYVIEKCLQKDAGRRYRNVAELAQDLARFGPDASRTRAVHIAGVVREGGGSVRPPSPLPGSLDTGPDGATSPAAAKDAGAGRSSRDVPTVDAIDAAGLPKKRPPTYLIVAAAAALLSVVGLVTSFARPAGSTATPTASSTPTAIPTPTSPATSTANPSSDPGRAAATTTPAPPAMPVPNETSQASARNAPSARPPSPPEPVRSSTPRGPRASATAAPPPAAIAPPVATALPPPRPASPPAAKPASTDDYSQFGGRP